MLEIPVIKWSGYGFSKLSPQPLLYNYGNIKICTVGLGLSKLWISKKSSWFRNSSLTRRLFSHICKGFPVGLTSGICLEHCQTFVMELFCENRQLLKSLNYFWQKGNTIDIWQGSKVVSVNASGTSFFTNQQITLSILRALAMIDG